MNYTLLEDVTDLTKCTVINIGYDYYLMMEDEDCDEIHEIHTSYEESPDGKESYIYMDRESITPIFFDVLDIENELNFETWEELEEHFEA